MATGLALQAIGLAWIAAVTAPDVGYVSLVGPFILSGIGMGMFFAPVAYVVLSAVRPQEEGKASGANNAIREVGGVFGVAVLASLFAHYGGYETPDLQRRPRPRTLGRRGSVGAGSLLALLIPRRQRRAGGELVPSAEAA